MVILTEKTTISTLVSLAKPINLPASAKTVVKKKNALLIIPDSGKKILLFPTDSDTVVKISLELRSKGLSPLFFNEVGRITKGDLGVEILYTSGLCFAEEKCVWDGFFEEAAKFKNPDDIKKKFQGIDGVNSVSIEFVKL
nr:hypothetical protein [Candidatus Sigynarchaeota archaeon]